jgi:S-adenosylmethionine synthetase
VGKLYNVLANKVANEIVSAARGDIIEAHTRILSQIGRPIDRPQAASANIIYAKNVNPSRHEKEARALMDEALANITDITREIVNEKVTVF